MNGLKTILEILREPKYPQICGSLILMNGGIIVGKCAMGEIACKMGVKIDKKDFGGVNFNIYKKILAKTNLPKWIIEGDILPIMYISSIGFHCSPWNMQAEKWFDDGIMYTNGQNIQDYIMNMNDNGFKYYQIIEFLETTFGQ